MKNASKHADELKALCKRLLKEYKPQPRTPLDPLKALVRGMLSFDATDSRADDAMAVIEKEFCDLNELRVATDLEIQEMLGTRYPQIEKRVAMMTQDLNFIFEKEHTLNLNRLKESGKKEVRQFLRDLPEMNPFVDGYVMLFAFDAGAMPVDEEILEYLKEEEVVEPDATAEDAQKFVENQLKTEELYDFFVAVRQAAVESPKSKKKAKA
jgi:endonuclease III